MDLEEIMSEGMPEETSNMDGTEQPTSGDENEKTFTQSDVNKMLAEHKRELRSENEELKQKAAEYDKIVEANKSEQEKQAERLAELESQVAEYETRERYATWRSEVAAEVGLPLEKVQTLAGDSKEEILANAQSWKSDMNDSSGPRPIPSEGQPMSMPLNSNALEEAMKSAVGIR